MQQITTQFNGRTTPIVVATPIKYCLYARKSTESEERQILSIDSQIKEMLAVAQQGNLNIVEIKRESHSSKEVGQRPVFNQMISEIREGKYNGILTWAPDRLSRNAGDLGSMVDLMDQKLLVEIRTHSQVFTNNPNEKFLLMILGSQAKLENDNRGINVKRGMKTKCEMGWRPGTAPTGYLNEKNVDKRGQCHPDPKRAPMVKQIFEKMVFEKWSGRKICIWLRKIRFKTKNDKRLSLSNIYLLLRNPFYYGEFEYPKGSNQWYQGKHTPIITKELFDRVQETLNENFVPRTDEPREFAFTKTIKCGYCGSGVTAEEKLKKLKNGGINRHVYYMCTAAKDIGCKNPPINEPNLINDLIELTDKIELDASEIKSKIEKEISRFNKFQVNVLGHEKEKTDKDVDIRNYVKYLLKEGSLIEKREMMEFFKSQLILKDKKVVLQ